MANQRLRRSLDCRRLRLPLRVLPKLRVEEGWKERFFSSLGFVLWIGFTFLRLRSVSRFSSRGASLGTRIHCMHFFGVNLHSWQRSRMNAPVTSAFTHKFCTAGRELRELAQLSSSPYAQGVAEPCFLKWAVSEPKTRSA
jgi:hypothetical protein